MNFFSFFKNRSKKKEKLEDLSLEQLESKIKNKKVMILDKIYILKGIEERKGIEGFSFYRKYKKRGKIINDEYFLPFSYIYVYNGNCINKKYFFFLSDKLSIKIYLFLYVISFFFFSLGYFLFFSIIFFIVAFLYYRNLFKVRLYLSLNEENKLDGILILNFEDHNDVCYFLEILNKKVKVPKIRKYIISEKKFYEIVLRRSFNDINRLYRKIWKGERIKR